MLTLYIGGPMTGYPDLNYPAFHKAENDLEQAGFTTLNPAHNNPDEKTWLNFMRMSLVQISQAHGLALLPDWHRSKGAQIEYQLFCDLGLEVRTVEQWLTGQLIHNEHPTLFQH